jgi:hypothetical protein
MQLQRPVAEFEAPRDEILLGLVARRGIEALLLAERVLRPSFLG